MVSREEPCLSNSFFSKLVFVQDTSVYQHIPAIADCIHVHNVVHKRVLLLMLTVPIYTMSSSKKGGRGGGYIGVVVIWGQLQLPSRTW